MKVYTQSAQLIKYMFTGGLTTGVNYLIYFILLGAAGDAAQQSRVYRPRSPLRISSSILQLHGKNGLLASKINMIQ